MTPCPLGCEPMSRGERRRKERELARTMPAPGLGRGWRISQRGRRYPVQEPPRASFEQLVAESDAVAARLGCGCVGSLEVAA